MDNFFSRSGQAFVEQGDKKISHTGWLIMANAGKNPIFYNLFLFFKYSHFIVKSNFQYRLNAVLLTFGVFIREFVNIVIIYLVLLKFGNLNNWNLNEMLFLFSLIYLSYSILVLFFTGIRDFSNLIHTGQFDRYLVRPLGLFFQIVVSKADYFASIGHGTVGVILFINTANAVGITWNPQNILYYLSALSGGVLIQLSIWMISASFSFWTIKADNIVGFLFWNIRKFAGYPISIFPLFIRNILMFVIPFAFVNYFPAQYFLNKPDMKMFWNGFIYLPPVVGVVMFIIVSCFWRISLKHYSGTGTAE
jgi:ABC-2 type transport system permease protein